MFPLGLAAALFLNTTAAARVYAPVVVETNLTFRIMAANITSGNNRRYEGPGIRIFQGLKPDIVAVQEFNYASSTGNGINTPAAIREFVDIAFGTNFNYYRESGYSIPNGIVSRFPILASGSWVDVDPGVNDRGFAWAKIQIPGTNELYVISVHFKASSGSDNALRRTMQATNLVNLIQANIPDAAWVAVGGDLNIHDSTEAALGHLKTILSDVVIPTDAVTGGDPDTNANRSERYDYVLLESPLAALQSSSTFPSHSFPKGLVFDSRVFSTSYGLADVSPVQAGDSGVNGMQHMAVMKDFTVSFTVTNEVLLPAPLLSLQSPNQIHWSGPSNLVYRVEGSSNLTSTGWQLEGNAASTTTNYQYTFTNDATPWHLFRVVYP